MDKKWKGIVTLLVAAVMIQTGSLPAFAAGVYSGNSKGAVSSMSRSRPRTTSSSASSSGTSISAGTTAPIDSTGILNNSYWGIVPNKSGAASQNAQNITKALAWAAAQGKTTVMLATATYYVNGVDNAGPLPQTGGISVPSGITFNLNGSTLIQIANSSVSYSLLNITKQQNVTVTNGTLVGDRQTHDYSNGETNEYGFGIDVNGSTGVMLSNLSISQMTGDAIILSGADADLAKGGSISKNITISGCQLFSCRRQGISVIGADTVAIRNNNIHDIKGTDPESGIDLEGECDWPVTNVAITGNTILNANQAAVVFSTHSSNCTLSGNTLNNNVSVIVGSGHKILNNKISEGGVLGFGTNQVSKLSIQNNTLTDAFIYCDAQPSAVVSGNTITNGYIKFSNSTGAVTGNILNSSIWYQAAIFILADGTKGTGSYQCYALNNKMSGTYKGLYSSSTYSGLSVLTSATTQYSAFLTQF